MLDSGAISFVDGTINKTGNLLNAMKEESFFLRDLFINMRRESFAG